MIKAKLLWDKADETSPLMVIISNHLYYFDGCENCVRKYGYDMRGLDDNELIAFLKRSRPLTGIEKVLYANTISKITEYVNDKVEEHWEYE